jgi:hypothetical protein
VAVSEGRAHGAAARGEHPAIEVIEVRQFLAEKKIRVPLAKDDTAEPPEKRDRGPDLRPPLDDRGLPVPDRARRDAGPSAEDERAADTLLRRAKLFANDPDNKDYYAGRLRELIKRYPGTAAAKEAEKLLDGLNK